MSTETDKWTVLWLSYTSRRGNPPRWFKKSLAREQKDRKRTGRLGGEAEGANERGSLSMVVPPALH